MQFGSEFTYLCLQVRSTVGGPFTHARPLLRGDRPLRGDRVFGMLEAAGVRGGRGWVFLTALMACTPTLVRRSDTVRIETKTLDSVPIMGKVLAVNVDSIVLEEAQGGRTAIDAASVETLEVDWDSRHSWGKPVTCFLGLGGFVILAARGVEGWRDAPAAVLYGRLSWDCATPHAWVKARMALPDTLTVSHSVGSE